MKELRALLERLSLAFGPSGCEGEIAAIIREELAGLPIDLTADRVGNLIAHVPGKEGASRVMLSAHMDEVGFMITDIEENGFLRFGTVGGIDTRVMVGRAVKLLGKAGYVCGVISAKGIHLQSSEEREKLPTLDEMYIDIGADNADEAKKYVERGDYGTFDTCFLSLGPNGEYLSGKAIDDRVGCALLIELLHRVAKEAPLDVDLYCAFTVREEIGISGATNAANRIAPHIAVVLEATAMADLPDVPAARRVADTGKGGVLSLADRSTIYDRDLIQLALAVGEKSGIPVQVKRFVSGGNDAGNIQRTGIGVRCLALSAPTRYLHAPVSVVRESDIEAMLDLLLALLPEFAKEGI
ncbi:MAG: M28 family peptidase [Clostridia bacterium]|nr:M28 family peptidase [Clostridia bacterium]